MKRHLALLTTALAFIAAPTFTLELAAALSPDQSSQTVSAVFVGRYGESFELPYGWTAEAESNGVTEVVYIHRKSTDDFGLKPFQPKTSDYKLDRFAELGLMELVVIPKNAPGGLRRLLDIRAGKEKELNAIGATFKINDAPDADRWPADTFHVAIQHPYRIIQTYAESPSEFYILTAGERLRSGEYGLTDGRILDYQNASDVVSATLGSSLKTLRGRTLTDRFFRSAPQPPALPGRPVPTRILVIIGLSLTTMLILALWPGTSGRGVKTRLLGRSLLFFSLASALTGFLTVYLPARFGGIAWRNPEDALAFAALATPMIAWAASRVFNSSHKGSILAVTSALTAAWGILLIFGPRSASATNTAEMLMINSLAPFMTGIIFAVAFMLAFGSPPGATKAPK